MDPNELLAEAQRILASRSGGNAHLMSTGLTPSSVHIDVALSNLALSYANEDFIADEIMPVVNVPFRTGIYWKFDKETAFNVASVNIASQRGRPNEINQKVGQANFGVHDYGLMGFVPFDVQAMADRPLNPAQMEIKKLTEFLSLAREVRVAAKFTSANFSGSYEALTSTARWDDYTNSDPAAKVDDILDSLIIRPNTAILGAKVYRKLKSHPKFQAYIQSRASYDGGATPLRVTRRQVAEAFELDNVFVPKARYVSSVDGASSLSLSRVWPDDMAAFIYVQKSPSLQETRGWGYTFRYAPPGGNSMSVISWFDQTVGVRGGTYYKETHSDTEELIAGADAGYLLGTVVS
jgi:hypothetical protein